MWLFRQGVLDSELRKLLQKGVIESATHSPGEYISNVFLRNKSVGGFRVILDLSELNQRIRYTHFKMDDLRSAMSLMTQGCYMASIDLSDAYDSIPIWGPDPEVQVGNGTFPVYVLA